MAFCTECGFKLPDEAVFCPNCGASLTAISGGFKASEEKANDESTLSNSESFESPVSADTVYTQNSEVKQEVLQGSYPSPSQSDYTAPVQGTYNDSMQGSVSAPMQSTYPPQPQGSYTVPAQNVFTSQPQGNYAAPVQNGYAPQFQNQYSVPVGYPPQQNQARINTLEPKSNSGKIAAIVISAAVVLLLLAGFFIYKAISNGNSYVGYWESCAVDVAGVQTQDYEGQNIIGFLGIQINEDGTAFMCSADDEEVYEGTWQETEDGITVTDENDTYFFANEDGKLYLANEDANIVFKKTKGDINNPSIPHGSLAGSSEDEMVNQTNNVAGSGYVGNDKFYISIIGAEEFIDVDNEHAMRVYYEFTNEGDYPISAYDALGVLVTQAGNDLVGTYAYETCDTSDNLYRKIHSGVTIQCSYEIKYEPNDGEVDFAICGWDDGETGGIVEATYDPNNLPGAPAPYVIRPVDDPQWTMNIPSDGTLDDYYYVSVLDAELITDAEGNAAIRINYEFTNNGSEQLSLSEALSAYTYQDGISLDTSYATEDSDTDMNFYTQIAPGESIQASCIFSLRNTTSPVEAEIEAYNDHSAVGQTYDIK